MVTKKEKEVLKAEIEKLYKTTCITRYHLIRIYEIIDDMPERKRHKGRNSQ